MFRSREAVESWVQAAGAGMFFFSLQAGLALVPYNLRFYEMFPAGGLVGGLVSDGLRMWLNRPGSAVFLSLVAIASVYLMTTFSVEHTTEWASEKFAWIGAVQDRLARAKASIGNTFRFRKPSAKVPVKPHQMPSPVAVRATQVVELEPEPVAEDAYSEEEVEPEPIPPEYIQAADIFQVGYRVAEKLGVVHEFA